MTRLLHYLFVTVLMICLTACDNSSDSSSLQYVGSGTIILGPGKSVTLPLFTKGNPVPLTIALKDNCLVPVSDSDLIRSKPGIAYVGTVGSIGAVTEGISNLQTSNYVALQPAVDEGGYIVKFTTKEPGNSAVSSWIIKLYATEATDGQFKIAYQVMSSAPQPSLSEPSQPAEPSNPDEPVVPSDPEQPSATLRLLGGNSFTATNGTIAKISLQSGSSKIILLGEIENGKISFKSSSSILAEQPRISSTGPVNSIINIDENDYDKTGLLFASSVVLYDQYGYIVKFATYDAATRADIPWVIKFFCTINQTGVYNIEYKVYTTASDASLSADSSSGNLQAFEVIDEDTSIFDMGGTVTVPVDLSSVNLTFMPSCVYVKNYSGRVSTEPKLAYMGPDYTLASLAPELYSNPDLLYSESKVYESGACYIMKLNAFGASKGHLYIVTMQPHTNPATATVTLDYRVYRQ